MTAIAIYMYIPKYDQEYFFHVCMDQTFRKSDFTKYKTSFPSTFAPHSKMKKKNPVRVVVRRTIVLLNTTNDNPKCQDQNGLILTLLIVISSVCVDYWRFRFRCQCKPARSQHKTEQNVSIHVLLDLSNYSALTLQHRYLACGLMKQPRDPGVLYFEPNLICCTSCSRV